MSEQLWDERYRALPSVFGEEPNDFVRAQARLLKPRSRLLCVGDGEGRNGVYLASLGHDVVSLDQSSVGLEKARQLAAARGVEIETWHVGLEHYIGLGDPPARWDAVVCIFVHLPPQLRRQVARELTVQTAPGGLLLLEAYTPAQRAFGTGGPKDPELLMTRADVVADWSEGWQLDVRIVEREIHEGPGHRGLSSVVQAIGLRQG